MLLVITKMSDRQFQNRTRIHFHLCRRDGRWEWVGSILILSWVVVSIPKVVLGPDERWWVVECGKFFLLGHVYVQILKNDFGNGQDLFYTRDRLSELLGYTNWKIA